ncbi:uncharacterized protein LOC128553112 [Mercenaria mercenaria]|uniref:uncharacterized protein LOC128553112 n=1 Tax=Mercenaria mercenaria TaxID=6596 RepID=UPI00234E91CF|nr:uncharacterized protein LOC128553112 [Mercenaria mercenaria]
MNDRSKKDTRQGVICYECGQRGNLKYNCQNPGNESKTNLNISKKHNVKSSSNVGSGLYVEAKINGFKANCLIDTGATLSVISSSFLDNNSCTVDLENFEKDIVTASGSPIEIKGKTKVNIEINGETSSMPVVVSKIEGDAILGLDFMKARNIVVDIVSNEISVNGTIIKLNCSGPIGCYRVVVAEKVEIPARSEVIIQGKSIDPIIDKGLYVTEPNENFVSNNKGFIARALVEAKEKVPIRILNPLVEKQVIYPGTNISTLSPVENVKLGKNKSKQSFHIPSHIQDLYERTTEDMDKTQMHEVAKLLKKYAHIFSESDNDIGRTGIIRYQIPTGDARPIKQPLRRLPQHMSDEV